ncbi:MAG: hypothetical protein Q4G46_09135 [Propionibacteriaceae bacterium]|nr:hypothetical protein [Propionibacteriaceae bacterium]
MIEALTTAARREREAKVDQLVLIARAAEVWSWVDNVDDVVDSMLAAELGATDLDADEGAGQEFGERLWRYGGEGAPEVSEFLRLEVGPALGISPEAAAGLIGDVLDLRHRLPGLWAQVEQDRVVGWVACKVARLTREARLSQPMCRALDQQISGHAPGWTTGKIIRQTKKLIVLLDPETAEAKRRSALAARFVTIAKNREADGQGVVHVWAQLDGVEGLDLQATIDAVADVLETVDADEPRPVLRARALELLADPARAAAILNGDVTSLLRDGASLQGPSLQGSPLQDPGGQARCASSASDRAGASETTTVSETAAVEVSGSPSLGSVCGNPMCGGSLARTASLVVHVHPADLAAGSGGEHPRLGLVVRSQLDELLAKTSKVTVRPVIDPMAVSISEFDTPPPAMRQRVILRNPTVVFPFSDRNSSGRWVDLDHTVPRPEGPTTEPNLGPLDRRSHRFKTHAGCRLEQVRNGVFRWMTPTGQIFWVTPHGTFSDDPGPGIPHVPPPRNPAQRMRDLLARAGQALQRAAEPDPVRPERPDPSGVDKAILPRTATPPPDAPS